jgi:hypothetical protein
LSIKVGQMTVAKSQGASPVEWILEVEADTGKIVTQPLVLSSEALVWLEECRFTLPGSWGVQ